LVNKWEYYGDNKYTLFMRENLAIKSKGVAKKFFTIARHIHGDTELVELMTYVWKRRWLLIFQNPLGCGCPPQITPPGSFANSPQLYREHNPDMSTLFGFG
jgi:hypothetical protein